ncbi:MAG: hypothetical protein IPL09_01960 [Bacteroidetes bacterium]|jgi:hypothetical protein|nr:hypothetical protein [Bacteroidota bacterium]MBK7587222.1 hypothetical protein [Bacteroidota bacterium]MBK8328251.1 hypothetical protein [Bacteroidota bacterium]MBK9300207.1 hypothetical protein [Bacteroidota bacterium]MBK9482901.1 hypothetical protein [Bacteroidota bacterium]
MISINSVHKIDYVNIGLLILSCILAFLMPFELFLFAYGVLGPLHYLTEISWLHDKNYYSTDKRDVILLVVISLVLTVVTMKNYLGLADLDVEYKYVNRIIFIAFASSLFFAFIKNNLYKIIGVCIVILLSAISDRLVLIFSVFLPTLIHVFLFTWLFMFYGALKNRSKPGYITVALHMVIPFILFYAFPSTHFVAVTDYGKSAYKEFQMLNLTIISLLNNSRPGDGDMVQQIFNSQTGIAIMRFIAFAYTYHYLNWFSKTKVIRWHDIPKSRSIFIVILWVISIILYAVDYSLGFKWLFLLSFMHVMVEFPLNYISFVGIFKELTGKGMKHSVN